MEDIDYVDLGAYKEAKLPMLGWDVGGTWFTKRRSSNLFLECST